MAKSLKVVGLEEAARALEALGMQSREIAGRAIFEGGAVVADELKRNIQNLPLREEDGHQMKRGATQVEKDGLLASMGIATLRDNGDQMDVQVGFDGYNADATEGYPQGKPNPMIARSLESGTSWLTKTPFIAPAERATRARAEAKMEQVIDREIQKRSK